VSQKEEHVVQGREGVRREAPGEAAPVVASGPYPVVSAMARGVTRLPPGPLGRSLARLTPIQRAVILAEILGPPLASRPPGERLGPIQTGG
jgi:hypothetical protein